MPKEIPEAVWLRVFEDDVVWIAEGDPEMDELYIHHAEAQRKIDELTVAHAGELGDMNLRIRELQAMVIDLQAKKLRKKK